jgi:hypothetical protein
MTAPASPGVRTRHLAGHIVCVDRLRPELREPALRPSTCRSRSARSGRSERSTIVVRPAAGGGIDRPLIGARSSEHPATTSSAAASAIDIGQLAGDPAQLDEVGLDLRIAQASSRWFLRRPRRVRSPSTTTFWRRYCVLGQLGAHGSPGFGHSNGRSGPRGTRTAHRSCPARLPCRRCRACRAPPCNRFASPSTHPRRRSSHPRLPRATPYSRPRMERRAHRRRPTAGRRRLEQAPVVRPRRSWPAFRAGTPRSPRGPGCRGGSSARRGAAGSRHDPEERQLEPRALAARQLPDLLERVVAAEQEPGEVAARLARRDRHRRGQRVEHGRARDRRLAQLGEIADLDAHGPNVEPRHRAAAGRRRSCAAASSCRRRSARRCRCGRPARR